MSGKSWERGKRQMRRSAGGARRHQGCRNLREFSISANTSHNLISSCATVPKTFQGAITKRMTTIEEMAGMDALCSDKTGTLSSNCSTVDRNLVEVFAKDMAKDTVVLLASREARRSFVEYKGIVPPVLDNRFVQVGSWRGNLLDRGILTVSVVPRDNHEAHVQFALERGIPAILGIISTQRLPFPSSSFDMAHCSRCLIPRTEFGMQSSFFTSGENSHSVS